MIINERFPLVNSGFSNTENSLNLPRHRWYYFKEGFSPNIVEFAIQNSEMPKDSVVLDPFNGSGTVTLESVRRMQSSVGIEVNPFAAFLSKTKLSQPRIDTFSSNVAQIRKAIKNGRRKSPLLKFSTFSENSGFEKWLFNESVLNSFYNGLRSIDDSKGSQAHNLAKLALIGAAMDNCNAIRDGKCLRYRKNWTDLGYDKTTFQQSFEQRLENILEDLTKDKIRKTENLILEGDARRLLYNKNIKNFDLCITSPPYLNSFDYCDVYRPELFLGEFISNGSQLLQLRRKTVRSHASVRRSELRGGRLGLLFDSVVERLTVVKASKWERLIPLMVRGYFEDMELVLHQLATKANYGANLWLIVSNSAYNGVEVPVDLILAEIATHNGWNLREIGLLRNIPKRGSRYSPGILSLRESVVILQRKNV